MKVEVVVLGSPSLISLMVSVDVNQHFNQRIHSIYRSQELCKSRGGRPGLPSLISLMVSVDVKQHFDQRIHSILYRAQELCESPGGRPGLPSLISLMVSVDVKLRPTSTLYIIQSSGAV